VLPHSTAAFSGHWTLRLRRDARRFLRSALLVCVNCALVGHIRRSYGPRWWTRRSRRYAGAAGAARDIGLASGAIHNEGKGGGKMDKRKKWQASLEAFKRGWAIQVLACSPASTKAKSKTAQTEKEANFAVCEVRS